MKVLVQRLKSCHKTISCVLRQITICKSLPKIYDPSSKLGEIRINLDLRGLSTKVGVSQEWFEIASPTPK
jgi:hypothetical protein